MKFTLTKDEMPKVGQPVLAIFEKNGKMLITYIIEHDTGFSPKWQWDSLRHGKVFKWISTTDIRNMGSK